MDSSRRVRDLAGIALLVAGAATVTVVAFVAHPLAGAALVGFGMAAAGLLLGRG